MDYYAVLNNLDRNVMIAMLANFTLFSYLKNNTVFIYFSALVKKFAGNTLLYLKFSTPINIKEKRMSSRQNIFAL